MKRHLLGLCASAALLSSATAQIFVEKVFSFNQTIADNGQYVDVRTLSDLGMSSILDVDVGLVMQSAPGKTIRLGDYFVSLTHGIASEEERVAVLLNRAGANDTRPWGSSLNAVNLSFDDSVDAANSFGVTSTTGTYAADGRLAVDPYGNPLAFDALDVTHGLGSLDGEFLESNVWSLLVADTRQGGEGVLSSWTLGLTGPAAQSGKFDPGLGGTFGDVEGSGIQDVKAMLLVSGSGANSVTVNVSENLVLSGGLSGNGNLRKFGVGELILSGDSSGFTGSVDLSQGVLQIARNDALGVGVVIEVSGSGSILKLANSAQLDAPISLSGSGSRLVLDGNGILGGRLTGDGGLRIDSSGKVTLTGTSTYTGGTSVSSGTLIINGDHSGAPGALSVASGATLGGSGTIGGATHVSGTHSPGNSPGIQTFDSLLTYSAGSSVLWDLGVNAIGTRGSDYDGINANRGLNFAGVTTLSLGLGNTVDWSNAFWDSDQIGTNGWKVFSVVETLDGFDNLSLDSIAGGLDSKGVPLSAQRPGAGFNLYQESGGIYLNYQVAAVPEPSYLLGIICLLAGWACCRRR